MATTHSTIVGGSSADRVLNCPGSNALLAKLPAVTDRDSFYSREGTVLHDLMVQLITGKVKMKKLPKMVDGIPITQELIHDAIEPAMDFWKDFVKQVDEWQLETAVHFPGIEGAFGTADVLGRNKRENCVHVVDWKFGSGVGVSATYPDPDDPEFESVNSQLCFYGCAARHTKPAWFPPGCRVILTIVQPRAREGEPVTSAEVTLAELDAFADALRTAVSLVNPPTRPGRWCRFAACQTICEHHVGPLLDLNALGAPVESAPGYMDELLRILAHAPAVENLIREARSQAHLIMANGGDVPGWKLVAKRGTRQWTVDEKTLAKKLKLPKDKLYDMTLKSPAGIERIVKKLPDGLCTTVSSGTTIARVEDRRPAIVADPDALRKILLAVLEEKE